MDSMSSITKNGKKRSPNYTPSEVVTIQEEVIKNRQLLEGKYNDLVTKRKVQRCWEHITEMVNAAGLHSRTVIDIKEKWRSMRKNAKRDFAEKKKESLKTGGGGPPATLSASSQRIIEEYQGSASFNGIPGASSLESIVLSENGNNDPYLIYIQDLASGEDNHLVTLDVNPEDFDLPIGGSELELHNEDRPPFEEFIDPITTASETRAKETTHESNSNNKESRKRPATTRDIMDLQKVYFENEIVLQEKKKAYLEAKREMVIEQKGFFRAMSIYFEGKSNSFPDE